MRIDEADRLHLFEVARQHWADEGAARTLMNLLPPDRDELATKTDIAQLAQATKTDIAQLAQATKADLAQLAQATKADIAQLAQATKADLAQLRSDVRSDVLGRMNAMLLAMVGMWITLVALFAAARFG